MSLHCLVGHHKPQPSVASNQGFHFSSCRCCGRNLVRSGRKWRRVPKGFRVVWRSKAEAAERRESRAASRSNPHTEAALPAIRTERAAPRLEGLIDLVRAAMRVALWSWRDRWRCLDFAKLVLPRPSPSVLRLPAR